MLLLPARQRRALALYAARFAPVCHAAMRMRRYAAATRRRAQRRVRRAVCCALLLRARACVALSAEHYVMNR